MATVTISPPNTTSTDGGVQMLVYISAALWVLFMPAPRLVEYKGLALSGGAQLGFAHVAYLQTLQQLNLLAQTKTFVGTSVGAVVAFLFTMGVPLMEIMRAFSDMSLGDLINLSHFEHLKENYGLDTGEWLIAHIMMTLHRHGLDPMITFQQLEDLRGYNLTVVATQFDTNSAIYFRSATHPHVPIIKAVRFSIGLPLLFTLATFEGHSYIDGAFRDNFPFNWLSAHMKPEDAISGNLIIGSRPRVVSDVLSYVYNLFVVMTSLVNPEDFRNQAVVSEILDVPMVAYTTTPANNKQCFQIAQLATLRYLFAPEQSPPRSVQAAKPGPT